ncbi:TetR/AcrR family transcriptional regulator [Nocardia sp. GCM10030253]|uniref:TetR/AcrR family transcriptional regulator n=1 Tax=Nocardia sp. GCM10030253 TaxID=3273404 RepID=UPI00363A5C6C
MPEQPRAARRGRPPEAGLAQRRRRQIIESAYVVFAERGYEGTAISDVAAHASIGQGTVYRYFTSKREILDHVVDFGIEKLVATIEPQKMLQLPTSAEDLMESLHAAASRIYDMVEGEPEFIRLLFVEASAIDKELADRLLGLEMFAAKFVARELRRGIEARWIRADVDVDVIAHTILTLVLPGLMRELRGPSNAEVRERTVAAVLNLMMKALRPRSLAP